MAGLRIAVIGAGMIGRTHIEALVGSPDASLAAVADPTPAAQALAAKHGVPHFADTIAMLDTVKPDGAIVAIPNALHVEIGLACLARGIVPLIEKPIAETVEAAERLVDAGARAGIPILIGHHRRHNPIMAKARELVRGGALGRLTAITALSLFRKPDDYFDVAWRREPGGGPVLINLIHNIDDMRFVADEIVGVQALTSSAVRGFPVEDSAAAVLQFAGGALGTAIVSDAVAAPWAWELTSGENPFFPPAQQENCYLFAGTAASLAVPRLALWRHPGKQGWQAPLGAEPQPVTEADTYARQLAHFCQVIRRAVAPVCDAADATRTLAVAMAVHAAARTSPPVTI